MSNTCRTCGRDILNEKALNIFAKNEYNTKEQIELITGVLLPNKSGFPSCICTGCQIRISRAIEFRECCIATQQIFLLRLSSKEQSKKDANRGVNEFKDTKPANDPLEVEDSKPKQVKEEIEIELDLEDEESFDDFSNSNDESVDYDDYEEEIEYELQYDNDEATEQTTEQKHSVPTKSKQKGNKLKKLSSEHLEAVCICDQCGKYFSNRRNLQLHQLRHTGVKAFECEYCDQKFYTASLLKIHGRKHTNPFKCTYCDETFGYNSSKKRHERIHRNERPFQCQYCDKSFICSTSMKGHENTHLRIRSFECKVCGVWFMSSKHLNSHYRTKSHVQTAMNDQRLGIGELTKS